MSEFTFKAERRDKTGTLNARRYRAEEVIPAIVYGAGKEPDMVVMNRKQIRKVIDNPAFHTHILELNLDGKKEKVVLKEVQRHPSRVRILHLDFMRVSMKEKLTMQVPLVFEGEEDAPGLKEGGVVSRLMTELEIRCLPTDLPESITVNVSELGMDDTLHLSKVVLPEGVELTITLDEAHDPAVASLHKPHIEKIEEPAEAAAEGEESPDAAAEERGDAKSDAAEEDDKPAEGASE